MGKNYYHKNQRTGKCLPFLFKDFVVLSSLLGGFILDVTGIHFRRMTPASVYVSLKRRKDRDSTNIPAIIF